MSKATFDNYSNNYEEALDRGISVSGEDSSYFARGRLAWLSKRLAQRRGQVQSVIDFGCGVGNSLPYIRDIFGAQRVAGIDVSRDSISIAQKRFRDVGYQLATCDELPVNSEFDLAFCNGVFHHIPRDERAASARLVFDHLKPGGYFAFFENNPLNPGTRYVMSRIPFDRDAITVLPWSARRLLVATGFTIVRTDYLFYFPKCLAWLRPGEPLLSQLPLGAQYLVLCQKPL